MCDLLFLYWLNLVSFELNILTVRDMHVVFQIPYVYDYVTKSCRQQIEAMQNHGGGHVYDRSSV
jgi:hypothetical protein